MPSSLYYLCLRVIINNNIEIPDSVPKLVRESVKKRINKQNTDLCCKTINCLVAIEVDHFECFQYAYEHDPYFDEGAYSEAASKGYLNILKCVRRHGRVSSWVMAEAKERNDNACVEFLQQELDSGNLIIVDMPEG